jgi:hypothetical protein
MALCLRKSALVSTSRPSVARPRVACNATYKVTLKTPSGEQTIECPDDTYILVSGSRSLPRRLLCASSFNSSRRFQHHGNWSKLRQLCMRPWLSSQMVVPLLLTAAMDCSCLGLTLICLCLFACRMPLRRLAWTSPTAAVQVCRAATLNSVH